MVSELPANFQNATHHFKKQILIEAERYNGHDFFFFFLLSIMIVWSFWSSKSISAVTTHRCSLVCFMTYSTVSHLQVSFSLPPQHWRLQSTFFGYLVLSISKLILLVIVFSFTVLNNFQMFRNPEFMSLQDRLLSS